MGQITKSLWELTTSAAAGVPDSGDLFLFAPQPGTAFVTECRKATAAQIIGGGVQMGTYLPVVTDGNGDPISNTVFTFANTQQYYVLGNICTILVCMKGQFPAMGVDTSFMSMSLPDFVDDVIINTGAGEMNWISYAFQFAGQGFFPIEFNMVDGYLFVDILPDWHNDGVTDAVTSGAADLEKDPAFFRISGQVTFQFATT